MQQYCAHGTPDGYWCDVCFCLWINGLSRKRPIFLETDERTRLDNDT